jgi:NitT/TauT family transport system ATP-binding protein
VHLDIEDLSFTYRDGTEALARVNLRIEEGTVHAIVGASGCGKSTLLRILGGLVGPTSGWVRFEGEQHHPQRTAMVFQTPALLNHWSVNRNVGLSAEVRRVKEPLYTKTVRFVTDRLGLSELGRRRAGNLSVGEQTRVAFGRAFVHDADVMLLDEPFSSLDAITRRQMWEELETHWQLEPRTYVIVTHDIEEAILLADEVTVMNGPPGHVAGTVRVDLDRPRSATMVADPGYRSAHAHIWELLESPAA